MRPKKEITVGMKVRFEICTSAHSMVGVVMLVDDLSMRILVGTHRSVWCTRRQIQSVFVKKKKVDHEEFYINEYPGGKFGMISPDTTLGMANQMTGFERTHVLKCRVIERIKC